ncbi:hypothetical protein EAS64_02910 [Trebonia kvetii]|uniref:DUF3322 and DUF2220 domain-containing protein n=1 Tax=Trebonia kvetii TaxID=2480626 RepID=A0A6P2C4P0_9ACTN|nr:DUF3322 domain-containing protein [Trebonia kvetii]TVZ06389.1 hypothetical protein EAS64_02910 [Trebonia kvetii]
MGRPVASRPWTRPADVREAVRRKWPELLTAFMTGEPWAPLDVPLRGPGPAEIGERLADVQDWAAQWQRAGRGPLRVEYKKIGGRLVGTNQIPSRAWLDGYDQAWELLGARREVRKLTELADQAKAQCPRVVSWLERRPVRALDLADAWPRLLATVRWIDECERPGMYVRQVDVPGVDTKFIEKNRRVLAELLDLQLDPARIDQAAPDFEGRYGFARKPAYVRLRTAVPGARFSEMAVRADEFTARPPGITRAYIVENEITYLAFPLAPDAIVLFGDGYAVNVLERLAWLAELELVYWGDIDTHGFAILNRLRHRFPGARSILMDRETLLAHQAQWVTESTPTRAVLDLLTPDEQELYTDLVGGTLGPAIRLEQERISFAAVEHARSAVFLSYVHRGDPPRPRRSGR